jgi:PhoH-like ATPase
MGKDIGYLPGDKDEKLTNWMLPIFDNLKYLLSGKRRPVETTVEQLLRDGAVSLEALTYIRGRSISAQFLVVDEAQNLTPHEVKTIISRAGENTKLVLTGDPYQIDNPYLDSSSNGLVFAAERLKDSELVGHMVLTKSERSELASLAAERL